MGMFQYLIDQYDSIDKELSDPRTKNRFLLSSPLPIFGLIITYLCLVKYIIPAYMKNREPIYLKSVIFYYNLVQIISNAYIVYLALNSGYGSRHHIFRCRDVNYSTTDPDALLVMECFYIGLISRLIEFLDTIFFALQKKNNHVSFLHVFHHSTMALNVWIAVKFVSGSSAVLIAIINPSVHFVMYSYYLLSSLGPEWRKYLWWKRYLTILQVIQLCCGLVGILVVAFTIDYCPELQKRKFLLWYMFLYVFILLCLFRNFYNKSYGKATNKVQNGSIRKTQ